MQRPQVSRATSRLSLEEHSVGSASGNLGLKFGPGFVEFKMVVDEALTLLPGASDEMRTGDITP